MTSLRALNPILLSFLLSEQQIGGQQGSLVLRVAVTDMQDIAVPTAVVQVYSTEWVGIADSDSKGLYSVSVPRPGTYGVNAYARGFKRGVGEAVLASRSQAADVRLGVQGCPPEAIQTVPGYVNSDNASLSGRVWELPQSPAHNVKVRLVSARSISLESSTDSGGHFLFRHVPPGPYDLVINDPRYRDVLERSLWIVSGRRATVDLRLFGHNTICQ